MEQPELIAGRYQVLRAIGRGGMGTVWLCHDEVLRREVAVKQIGALPGESATETRRAMREARSAAALNHPNVVAVYDVVTHDRRPWLVMEYVEGNTLADEISSNGQLPPQRVAEIGAQLAGALARAHERRIVHRDIKPANVLIDKAGRPKISDFGIARRHGDDQLTQTGFLTGTPGYLSPELARGGDPDWASDVWALGATLYAAVEGQPPYESRSNPIAQLMAIATERPRPMTRAGVLRPAINAMMDEDPARRWDMATSARWLGVIADGDPAVMARVDPSLATQVIPAPAVEPTQRLQPAPPAGDRRRGLRWLPLALVSLLLAALGVVYLVSQLGDQRNAPTVLGPTSSANPASPASPARSTRTTGSRASTTSEPPSPTSPPQSPTSPPQSTAAPGAQADNRAADTRLEDFVTSYYSDVTANPNRTWPLLTPSMQGAAGGRGRYDGFWKTIDKVQVNQTRADASAREADANLTFRRKDGTTSTETHRFTFVLTGGNYLMDSDQNLG